MRESALPRRIDVGTGEAGAAGQRDRRKNAALGDADAGVRRGERALGGRDVRATLEQFRGKAGRNDGRSGPAAAIAGGKSE